MRRAGIAIAIVCAWALGGPAAEAQSNPYDDSSTGSETGSGSGSGSGTGSGSGSGSGSGTDTDTETDAQAEAEAEIETETETARRAPATTTTTRTETTTVRSQSGSGSTATITRSGSAHSGGTVRTAGAPATARGAAAATKVPVHEEDDGRAADFFWFEVEGGVSYVDLILLQNQSLVYDGVMATVPGIVERSGFGPMVGAAGGFRLSVFALGIRGTFASYAPGRGITEAFDIGTFGGEVHLRIPTPLIEPYIRVGAGYAWMGNVNYNDPGNSPARVWGWTINGALGVDIFLTWWLSIGVGGQLDFLNLTRQVDPTADCMRPTDFCPTMNGDAVGLQARGFAQIGIHL